MSRISVQKTGRCTESRQVWLELETTGFRCLMRLEEPVGVGREEAAPCLHAYVSP